jgi:hypothetical protein
LVLEVVVKVALLMIRMWTGVLLRVELVLLSGPTVLRLRLLLLGHHVVMTVLVVHASRQARLLLQALLVERLWATALPPSMRMHLLGPRNLVHGMGIEPSTGSLLAPSTTVSLRPAATARVLRWCVIVEVVTIGIKSLVPQRALGMRVVLVVLMAARVRNRATEATSMPLVLVLLVVVNRSPKPSRRILPLSPLLLLLLPCAGLLRHRAVFTTGSGPGLGRGCGQRLRVGAEDAGPGLVITLLDGVRGASSSYTARSCDARVCRC